jgi:CHAT domain-containing protein/ABC-type Fe3+-citrate transport system substrate-binding protein
MKKELLFVFIFNSLVSFSKDNIDSSIYNSLMSGIVSDYKNESYKAGIEKCNKLINKAQKELEFNSDYLIFGYLTRGKLHYHNSDTSSGRKDLEIYLKLFLSKNEIKFDDLISYSKVVVEALTKIHPDTTFLTSYYEQIINRLGKAHDFSNTIYNNIIDEYIYINRNFVSKYDFLSKQFDLFGQNKNEQTKIIEHYMVLYDALTGHDNFSDSMINSWPPKKLMEIYLDFSSKGVGICEKYKPNDTLSVFFNNLYGFMLFSDNKIDEAIYYLEKSVELSYSIKFYSDVFIESIKNLSLFYNYKNNYNGTVTLLNKFDKLSLNIPKQFADELCTNRTNAIYSVSKNIQSLKQIADSIENKFDCKYMNKFGINNQKDNVDAASYKKIDTENINMNNVFEYIFLCQEIYREGNEEEADKGFQKIDEILKNYNQIEIPILRLLKLYFNIIYTQYIDDIKEEGHKKKTTCIQNIEEILNDKSFSPPKVLLINSYTTLMDYYKEQNITNKALEYGNILDSIFNIKKDNLSYLFYPNFLYSYYDIVQKQKQGVPVLDKAIKIEKETNIDIVSYQSYVKIFKELYIRKDKGAFEEYVNSFIPYLEQFINLNYLFYDNDRQSVKLSNYLIDIDMLIYYGQNLKCSIRCINSLFATLFSLRDLDVDTYKYLKQVNPENLEQIKQFNSLRDSIYKLSTTPSLTFDNNNLDDLLKQLNLDARKLMTDSKLKLVQFDKYNPDSIRLKLKPNECFIFNYRDAYFEDSTRQLVLKYDSLRFGIRFDYNRDKKSLIVSKVIKNSPSFNHIKQNDKIIQVNNIKTGSSELAQEIFKSKEINLKYLRGNDTLSTIITRDSVFIEYYLDYENWVVINNNQIKPYCLRIYIDDYNKLHKEYFAGLKSIYDANTFKITLNNLYPLIKENSNIYYSLADKYSDLNIEWLQNPEDSTYLGGKYNFYNCSYVSDFYILKNKQSQSVNKNMVVFANPSLNTEDNTLVINSKNDRSASEDISYYYKTDSKLAFSNLPYTEAEASRIKQIGENMKYKVTYFSKNECTESNIKNLHSPEILHIASHGYVLNPNDDIKDIFNSNYTPTNNLFNTALILSEYDKNKQEDGVLTAFEIINLDLKNTELVVLSACESATGETSVNGNSSNSLQRAFRIAGAKAVLASKWKVPDKQTGELMVEFYTNWLEKKMTKHKALQQAQLTLSKKYPEPYYWAAWVLYGE